MRAQPAVFIPLVCLLLLGPVVLAAPPQDMLFNGKPAADVLGQVNAVSMDGTGRWGAVAIADAGLLPTDDRDLKVFNLQSQGLAWDAVDHDLVNEGGKLVVVANGAANSEGQWIALVNNSVQPLLTVYQANGFGGTLNNPQLGERAWQYSSLGAIQDVAINGDGKILAVATGGATAANRSIVLLQNRYPTNVAPNELYRVSGNTSLYSDVLSFTSIALSINSTIPATADTSRALYTVVGAQTVTTSGLSGGAAYVFETVFSPEPQRPITTQVLGLTTLGSPVTRVAMSADGEYAVVGTQGGQVYLVSVSQALAKRGSQGLESSLRPWQVNLGSEITAVAIAKGSRDIFAAGTSGGDIALFSNQLNPQASEGAQGLNMGTSATSSPRCAPQLAGGVRNLALSDFGDELVVGAQTGILAFEAAAKSRYFGVSAPLDPAWCIGYNGDNVPANSPGVAVSLSGDGRRVFAGTGHRTFGYNNFYCINVDALAGGAERRASPGERVQWSITVRNDGSFFDRINLSASGPLDPGWQFQLSNSSLLLMPGRTQTVFLNVTSPPNLPPGNVTLQVLASPERAGKSPSDSRCAANRGQDSIASTLRLNLGQLRRVELRPPTGLLIASAGAPNTFPITIHNSGNAPDRFRVIAAIPEPQENFKSRGSDWLLRTEDPADHDSVVEVPAASDGVINLIVTPNAQRGDSATIELTVEPEIPAPDGGFLGDTKQVQVAIEPNYNGDIALLETKDFRAEPGQLIYINYTVKNLGNTRDVFQVKNRTEPSNAPGWKLQLSDERFELRRQNDQKVVRLSVFVQQGLQPGESVRIITELFSEGLRTENPGSDGLVDAQPVTVTVIPHQKRSFLGLPGPDLPVVVLAVLALAVAARRRGA